MQRVRDGKGKNHEGAEFVRKVGPLLTRRGVKDWGKRRGKDGTGVRTVFGVGNGEEERTGVDARRHV